MSYISQGISAKVGVLRQLVNNKLIQAALFGVFGMSMLSAPVQAQEIVSDPPNLLAKIENMLSDVVQYGKDVAHYGKEVEEWAKQVTHRAEQVRRMDEVADNWKKEYGVLTEAFDMASNLMSIASSIRGVVEMADDLKKTVDDVKERGAAGVGEELFNSVRNGVYQGRSQAIRGSCARRDVLAKKRRELEPAYAKRKEQQLKDLDSLASQVTANSSSVKIQSIQVAMDTVRAQMLHDADNFNITRSQFDQEEKSLERACRETQVAEGQTAQQKGAFPTKGRGLDMSGGRGNSASAGKSDAMF